MTPQLVVALDLPDRAAATDMARVLRGHVTWLKVGLELFTAVGPAVVADLKTMGFSVFLDLKFLDIPNTVRGAVRSACGLGADMLTLHALGGEAMLRAALEGRAGANVSDPGPLLMAVTVLTSMGPGETALLGRSGAGGPLALVHELTALTARAGLDGVVCSAHEARAVKQAHPGLGCLTPGIRLPEADVGDQRRVADPAFAVAQGAEYLVVGRPITAAADPAGAAQRHLNAMNGITP